jgi:hypothetical protein
MSMARARLWRCIDWLSVSMAFSKSINPYRYSPKKKHAFWAFSWCNVNMENGWWLDEITFLTYLPNIRLTPPCIRGKCISLVTFFLRRLRRLFTAFFSFLHPYSISRFLFCVTNQDECFIYRHISLVGGCKSLMIRWPKAAFPTCAGLNPFTSSSFSSVPPCP